MLGRERLSNGGDYLNRVAAKLALQLLDDDQLLALALDHAEGGDRPFSQRRVAFLDGELQVLGVELSTSQIDQILDAPGDAELAIAPKPQVAGAQEWPSPRVAQESAKGGLRRLALAPIAAGDAGAAHPDLPLHARAAGEPRRRVDDEDFVVVEALAAGDRGERLARRAIAVSLPESAGDEERRLGQAVARIESAAPKSTPLESPRESVQGAGADGLGAIEGETPRAEVEVAELVIADLVDA